MASNTSASTSTGTSTSNRERRRQQQQQRRQQQQQQRRNTGAASSNSTSNTGASSSNSHVSGTVTMTPAPPPTTATNTTVLAVLWGPPARSVTGEVGVSGYALVVAGGRGSTGLAAELTLPIANLFPVGLGLLLQPDPQTGGLPRDPAAVCGWEIVAGSWTGRKVCCSRDDVGSRISVHEVPGSLHKCSACGLRQLIEDGAAEDEGGRARFKRCPCRLETYCGQDCQRQHWPLHRAVCPAAPRTR